MPSINLKFISSIIKLPNKQFMHLYLQILVLVKKYLAITNNEYLLSVYEDMQKIEEGVKQLDVKLNVASEAVKKRNEVHKVIKDSLKYIQLKLESYLLSSSENNREKAQYITSTLAGLLDQKRITSVYETKYTIHSLKYTIETDKNITKALIDLGLITSMETLFKQGEEYDQLLLLQIKRTSAIDKKAIRKKADNVLRLLFITIEMNYGLIKDDVWMEMADGVRELVEEAK